MIFFHLVVASINQLMIFSVTKEYIDICFVLRSISKYARPFSGLIMPMSVKKSLFVEKPVK